MAFQSPQEDWHRLVVNQEAKHGYDPCFKLQAFHEVTACLFFEGPTGSAPQTLIRINDFPESLGSCNSKAYDTAVVVEWLEDVLVDRDTW